MPKFRSWWPVLALMLILVPGLGVQTVSAGSTGYASLWAPRDPNTGVPASNAVGKVDAKRLSNGTAEFVINIQGLPKNVKYNWHVIRYGGKVVFQPTKSWEMFLVTNWQGSVVNRKVTTGPLPYGQAYVFVVYTGQASSPNTVLCGLLVQTDTETLSCEGGAGDPIWW